MRLCSFIITALFFMISVTTCSYAGVSLDRTRVIINAGETGVVNVKNTSDKQYSSPYLIQSIITEYGKLTRPVTGKFFVSPPLFRLDPDNGMGVEIKALNDDGLPKDRESVFGLRVKAIPNTPNIADKNVVSIVVTSAIKVFYRPQGLNGNANDTYKSITASRQGNQLVITNTTPYYVTFQSLNIGGKDIPHSEMVPPLGKQSYMIPVGANGKISWQTINDFGGYSETVTRDI